MKKKRFRIKDLELKSFVTTISTDLLYSRHGKEQSVNDPSDDGSNGCTKNATPEPDCTNTCTIPVPTDGCLSNNPNDCFSLPPCDSDPY